MNTLLTTSSFLLSDDTGMQILEGFIYFLAGLLILLGIALVTMPTIYISWHFSGKRWVAAFWGALLLLVLGVLFLVHPIVLGIAGLAVFAITLTVCQVVGADESEAA